MEIEYTVQPEDLEAFWRYQRKVSGGKPSFSLVDVPGIGVILLFTGGSTVALATSFQRGAIFVEMFFGWFGAVFLINWWQTRWYRSLAKAQCEDPRGAWDVRDVRVVISPDQLQEIARGVRASYHWSVVWHIGLTQKRVYLFLTLTRAIVIPRRAFRDSAHCEEFVALARQYRQDWREEKPKPTGIITSLPPEPTAIRRADIP